MSAEDCYIQFIGPQRDEVVTVKRYFRSRPEDVCGFLAEFRDLLQAIGDVRAPGMVASQFIFWDKCWELASYAEDELHGSIEDRYFEVLRPENWEGYSDIPPYWLCHDIVDVYDHNGIPSEGERVYQVLLPDDPHDDWGLVIGLTPEDLERAETEEWREKDLLVVQYEGTIEGALERLGAEK